MQFPLKQAPDFLFDSSKWSAFCEFFQSKEVALNRISAPPQLPFGFLRNEDDSGNIETNSEIVFKLGWELVQLFRDALSSGELSCSGLDFPEHDRNFIQSKRWVTLWPAFERNEAWDEFGHFTDVLVQENSNNTITATILERKVVEFLRESARTQLGTKKTVLFENAKSTFGRVSSRVFNAAYKDVFGKSVGRPRKK